MQISPLPTEILKNINNYRIGSVPFLNAAPLTFGVENFIELEPPNRLAKRLEGGKLDAALLSVTELLNLPDYELGTEYGICSAGPVLSVFLAHTEELETMKFIDIDPATRTSIQLLRFVLRKMGLDPVLRPMKLSYPEAHLSKNILLIGNPAIDFKFSNHSHQYLDLGEMWTKLTGLPFVYAGWLMRKNLRESELEYSLNFIAQRGLENLTYIHHYNREYTKDFRKKYVGRAIYYSLGDKEREGLQFFLNDLESQKSKSQQSFK